MNESILVATDGSDDAAAAVRYAVSLARTLSVPLHAVAVVETRTAYDSGIVDPEEAESRLRERAGESLETVEAAAEEAGASVVSTVRSGVPHEEILAYANEYDVGTIVLGERGRSSFRRALLGSTVDGVVRLSDRPVVIVPAERDGDEGSGE